MTTATDYLSREHYRREVDDVLAAGWLPVCRADQVSRHGDRLALTLLGRPLLVVRDGESLRVLANVCAHRGATLMDDGPAAGSTIVCPYHRWAYRLDGSLIGAPMAGDTDVSDACLPAVRHALWEGFVLVNLSGDAAAPSELYGGLSTLIAPWRWGELVTVASKRFESTWNWKIMVENWIECYHHIGAHRETVEPYQPARTTRIAPSHGAPWAAMTVDTIDGVEGPPEEWMPGLDESTGRDLSVWGAFPLLLGGSVSRYGFWLQLVPIDVDRHDVIWHVVAHPAQLERFTDEHNDGLLAMLSAVHGEDMVMCARVQIGMASGLFDRVRLTPLESTIADFHAWLSAQLSRDRSPSPGR
jgi:phenylpropionate dioxygenase-like ring-hydroxylating dioxygenase large terminal subunit